MFLFRGVSLDPLTCQSELNIADERRNHYLVWLILKLGPCPDVDLKSIGFFEALGSGVDNDIALRCSYDFNYLRPCIS